MIKIKKDFALAMVVIIALSIISVMPIVSTNAANSITNNCTCPNKIIDVVIESPHNYPNRYDQTWNISEPDASQIRVHFSRLQTECSRDFVYIYDHNDTLIKKYECSHYDIWTPWVDGDTIKVRLTSDSSGNYYGFKIDKIEYMPIGGVLKMSTDKNIYNMGDIVNLTIEINRSAKYPVIALFKLELCDIDNKSKIANEPTPLLLPAELKTNTTAQIKIPDNAMWISGDQFVFRGSLIEPTSNTTIACDTTVFYVDRNTTQWINVTFPLP